MSNSDFIGLRIGEYTVDEPVAEGTIGSVYVLKRTDNFPDTRAIKFIHADRIRLGWENEIVKVVRLRTTDGVVKYQTHGYVMVRGANYLWIAWDFIPGVSFKQCIEKRHVTIPILVDVVRRVLGVLHACRQATILHGDLHAGNILVEDENPLYVEPERRRIWITDFGYCTASMGKEMLDDFIGLHRIIQDGIGTVDFHALDGQEKSIYKLLKEQFSRELLENHATEGDWVRNPLQILRRFEASLRASNDPVEQVTRRLGDYLAAELIGDRGAEWKELFVPEFVGRSTLLERNPCVLTGLRGCGKTMVFRRLTALFDCRLGPSSVEGADQFMGFYVNARSVAEAFPWLPDALEHNARNQIINYFHLCWCQEVLDWLQEECNKSALSTSWLVAFFKGIYRDRLILTAGEETGLLHLSNFITQELEKCRLKSTYREREWDLADLAFLEKLTTVIRQNVPSISDKPFFLFLDDYSTPLVNSAMQRILNPIVFRRSPNVIFKVATESTESFEAVGLNGKALEEKDDYVLIDSSSQVIARAPTANASLLAAILRPRIERDSIFVGRQLSLDSILGPTPLSNNELAERLRGRAGHTEVLYHGKAVFCAVYSSNIREMISLFADMVALEDEAKLREIPGRKGLIQHELQNKTLREAGGKFLSLLSAATNPSQKLFEITPGDKSFGDHLFHIADAFQIIASHELKTKRSKNEQANPPKQARRIELATFNEELPDDVREYYRGIIRYGLFIRDHRGKSARGKAVPRLMLRGLLIPFYTLTFSKRDSITMSFSQFCEFLRHPREFAERWKSGDESTPTML